jgi:hypothetical protein
VTAEEAFAALVHAAPHDGSVPETECPGCRADEAIKVLRALVADAELNAAALAPAKDGRGKEKTK